MRIFFWVPIGISILLVTAFNTIVYADTQIIDLELTTPADSPEASTIKNASDAFTRLDALTREEREQVPGRQELWETFNYVLNQADTNNADVSAEIEKMYQAISPKINSTSTVVSRKISPTASFKGIGKRLSALRRRAKSQRFSQRYTLRNLLPSYIKNNNPNETGGLFDQRLSGFVTGSAVISKQSDTSTESGFEGNTKQILMGADYRITNKSFAGAAISYARGSMDVSNDGGKLDNSAATLVTYGNYNIKSNWYIDTTLSFGRRAFELSRNVNFNLSALNAVNFTAESKPKSQFYGLSVGTGYDKNWNNGHNISFIANLSYSNSSIDSFTESNANGAPTGFELSIAKQTINSIQFNTGIAWRQAISTSFGILMPQLSVSWNQEFINESDAVNAAFIADTNNTDINFKTGNRDQGVLNIAFGISTILPKGISAFLSYESQQFVDDYQQYTIALGARKEF